MFSFKIVKLSSLISAHMIYNNEHGKIKNGGKNEQN